MVTILRSIEARLLALVAAVLGRVNRWLREG